MCPQIPLSECCFERLPIVLQVVCLLCLRGTEIQFLVYSDWQTLGIKVTVPVCVPYIPTAHVWYRNAHLNRTRSVPKRADLKASHWLNLCSNSPGIFPFCTTQTKFGHLTRIQLIRTFEHSVNPCQNTQQKDFESSVPNCTHQKSKIFPLESDILISASLK